MMTIFIHTIFYSNLRKVKLTKMIVFYKTSLKENATPKHCSILCGFIYLLINFFLVE